MQRCPYPLQSITGSSCCTSRAKYDGIIPQWSRATDRNSSKEMVNTNQDGDREHQLAAASSGSVTFISTLPIEYNKHV